MIRHHVLMTFADDVDVATTATKIIEALSTLPAQIPEIKRYEMGADLGLGEGTADLALIAEFDSVSGYEAYSKHPAHLRIIADVIRPNLGNLTRSQIEVTHPN